MNRRYKSIISYHTHHDRIVNNQDYKSYQRGRASNVEGVDERYEQHDRSSDDVCPQHTGLLDTLVVSRHEGDQLAQGGFTGAGKAEELGVADTLESSQQSYGCTQDWMEYSFIVNILNE